MCWCIINTLLLHQALPTTCGQKLNDGGQNQEKEAGLCRNYSSFWLVSLRLQKLVLGTKYDLLSRPSRLQ